MACIYQEDNTEVTKKCEVVELKDHQGEFEGRDAAEIWLDGYTFARPRGGTGRGRPANSLTTPGHSFRIRYIHILCIEEDTRGGYRQFSNIDS